MGTNNAFPNVIRDWTGLLAACADNASSLQPAEPQREALAKLLAEVKKIASQLQHEVDLAPQGEHRRGSRPVHHGRSPGLRSPG